MTEADLANLMLAVVLRRGEPDLARQADDFVRAAPDFCRRHLISATLMGALPGSGMPDEKIAELAHAMQRRLDYQDGLHQRLTTALAEIGKAFDAGDIDWRLIKGPSLQQGYYGALKREYFDLDIMVPASQFSRARRILAGLLWQPRRRGIVPMMLVRRFEHGLALQRGDGIVDLHWSLRVQPAYRIDESRVFAGERKVRHADIEVPVLEPEYDLTLCLLSIADGIERGRAQLRDAIDLYLVLKALDSSMNWPAFFDARKRERIDRICGSLLGSAVAWLDPERTLPNLRVALRQLGYSESTNPNPLRRCISREDVPRTGRRWYASVYPGSRQSYWLHTCLSVVINQEFPYNLPRTFLLRRFLRHGAQR
jgi:hypothetical protein